MALTFEQLNEFRDLYKKRYGKEISEEDAREQANKLLQLMILIYKPMSLVNYEAIQKRRLETLPEIIENIALHKNSDII